MPTPVSLRDQILASDDIESETIEVPQWGAKLEVRSMDGRTRARLLRECIDPETGTLDFEALYPQVVIATSFDPSTGERVFEETDVDVLNSKSGAALEIVAQAGMKISGMDDKAADRAGKDSSTTPSAASPSS